jgi:hypothetical protein
MQMYAHLGVRSDWRAVQRSALDSPQLRVIEAGEVVEVTHTQRVDGRLRLCCAARDGEEVGGWGTDRTVDGYMVRAGRDWTWPSIGAHAYIGRMHCEGFAHSGTVVMPIG